jgi:hypothetical protein
MTFRVFLFLLNWALNRLREKICYFFLDFYIKKIESGSGKLMPIRPDPDP